MSHRCQGGVVILLNCANRELSKRSILFRRSVNMKALKIRFCSGCSQLNISLYRFISHTEEEPAGHHTYQVPRRRAQCDICGLVYHALEKAGLMPCTRPVDGQEMCIGWTSSQSIDQSQPANPSFLSVSLEDIDVKMTIRPATRKSTVPHFRRVLPHDASLLDFALIQCAPWRELTPPSQA